MDCEAREEYNSAYILLQAAGKPIVLVVPTSLRMGWVESPPYFCAATETAKDIASDYNDTLIGSLPPHKFVTHVTEDKDCDMLPASLEDNNRCQYGLEVYVDDVMSIVIPTSRDHYCGNDGSSGCVPHKCH
jgi:hypothetical protein